MSDLGPEARQLVELARHADGPTTEDRDRVRAKLLARIATGAVATSAAAGAVTAATKGMAAKSASALWLKVLVTLTVAGGVGAGMLALLGGHRREPQPQTLWAPSGVASSQPGESTPSPRATGSEGAGLPTPESFPLAPAMSQPGEAASRGLEKIAASLQPSGALGSRPAESAPQVSGAAPPSSLEGEMRLVREAQESLRNGKPEQALQLLDRHQVEHPNGALGEERSAARVVALCSLGRTHEAQQEAERFLRTWPQSPLAQRVRSACATNRTTP